MITTCLWLVCLISLHKFEDVFQDEVPKELPPIRGIDHKIDLIPGAVIPNRPAFRANTTETKEI